MRRNGGSVFDVGEIGICQTWFPPPTSGPLDRLRENGHHSVELRVSCIPTSPFEGCVAKLYRAVQQKICSNYCRHQHKHRRPREEAESAAGFGLRSSTDELAAREVKHGVCRAASAAIPGYGGKVQ